VSTSAAALAPVEKAEGATPWAMRALGAALCLVLWEVSGRLGWFGATWPSFTEVLRALVDERDLLARSVRASLPTMVKGFCLGVSAGLLLAVLPQVVPVLRGVSTRFATVVNALPLVVLAPVLVTILGRDTVQVVVSGLACFFPMFIATSAGLTATRPSHLDVMTCLGSTRLSALFRVRLPAALPGIADGLRLAAPAAVLGAIFGEWFGAEKGLGAVLVTGMQNFRIGLLWAAALLSTLISIVALLGFTALGRWAQRRFS
jgi:ABC-type nitrate/sulfonate/bicarbonate transport system permease component